jgi:hypothetical protein
MSCDALTSQPDAGTDGTPKLEEERRAFCAALRAARERSGLTLAAIAASTKVREGRLAGLERSDLHLWPEGLFRRSFFCDYVRSIGLPVPPLLAEFVRLFPDSQDATVAPPPEATASPSRLRLTLAGRARARPAVLRARAGRAALDLVAVLLAAGLVAWSVETGLWTTAGLVALAYYPLSAVCFGQGLAGLAAPWICRWGWGMTALTRGGWPRVVEAGRTLWTTARSRARTLYGRLRPSGI